VELVARTHFGARMLVDGVADGLARLKRTAESMT
jgi:hypothetical protein